MTSADTVSITHFRVLSIALPIMVANLTVPLQGMVDTAVVGQIPSATPIAAVAVGAALISAVLWIFGFLRMGTAGLTAQALGAGDHEEVAAMLTRALLIGGAGGVLSVGLVPLLTHLGWAVSPASEGVKALADGYIQIRILSAPAAVAIFGINGWLVAQERTGAMLVLQLWMVGLNSLLSVIFVIAFDWGVDGVAWATFFADWTGLALGLWLCRGAFATSAWRNWVQVLDRERLKIMAVVNTDILLRSLLLKAIFLSFIFYYSAGFGDETLAASHVLLNFLELMAYALDGFAFAAEALVGQAFGARAVARIRRAVWLSSMWGMATAVLFALMFTVLGATIVDVMTKDPNVRSEARVYLPWVLLVPITALPSFLLDGIFIGATRTRDMRNMMVVSAILYFAAASALIPIFGAHGMWAALHVSFVARGVTLALRYPALERAAIAGKRI